MFCAIFVLGYGYSTCNLVIYNTDIYIGLQSYHELLYRKLNNLPLKRKVQNVLLTYTSF